MFVYNITEITFLLAYVLNQHSAIWGGDFDD